MWSTIRSPLTPALSPLGRGSLVLAHSAVSAARREWTRRTRHQHRLQFGPSPLSLDRERGGGEGQTLRRRIGIARGVVRPKEKMAGKALLPCRSAMRSTQPAWRGRSASPIALFRYSSGAGSRWGNHPIFAWANSGQWWILDRASPLRINSIYCHTTDCAEADASLVSVTQLWQGACEMQMWSNSRMANR
jgi:hypothetical protein